MALRLADAGDPTPLAFDAFYAAYARRVRGLVRRRVADDAIVEDLVQEVFLRVHRVADGYDATQPAWPWLATITVNVCTDASRRNRRVATPSDDIVELADRRDAARVDPADLYDDRTQMAAIGTALRAVEPRQRRTLIRRELEGLAYRELADREGVSEDTVRSLLKRARVRFRAEYEAAARQGGLLGGVVAVRGLWSRSAARLHRPLARASDTTSALGAPLGAFLMAAGLAVAVPATRSTPPAPTTRPVAVAASSRAAATGIGSSPTPRPLTVSTPRAASPRPGGGGQSGTRRPIDAQADAGIDRDGDHMTLFGKVGIDAGEYGNSVWASIDPGCTFSGVWVTACKVVDTLPPPYSALTAAGRERSTSTVCGWQTVPRSSTLTARC